MLVWSRNGLFLFFYAKLYSSLRIQTEVEARSSESCKQNCIRLSPRAHASKIIPIGFAIRLSHSSLKTTKWKNESFTKHLSTGKKLNTIYVLVGSDVIDDATQEDDAEVALFSIFQFDIQQPNFDLGEQSFFTLPYQPRSDQSSIFDVPTRLVVVDPDAYIVWPSSVLLTKGYYSRFFFRILLIHVL